jgi:hypothetical protein
MNIFLIVHPHSRDLVTPARQYVKALSVLAVTGASRN